MSESRSNKVFISYAECDELQVAQFAGPVQEAGYELYFGSGSASENMDEVAKQLSSTDACIVFLSNKALQSAGIRREVNYAINTGIPLICAYLDNCELTPGMRFQIEVCPSVYLKQNSDIGKLLQTLHTVLYGKKESESDFVKGHLSDLAGNDSRHSAHKADSKTGLKNKRYLFLGLLTALIVMICLVCILRVKKQGHRAEPEISHSDASGAESVAEAAESAEQKPQVPLTVLMHKAESKACCYPEVAADESHSEGLLESIAQFNEKAAKEAGSGILKAEYARIVRDDDKIFTILHLRQFNNGEIHKAGIVFDAAADGKRLKIDDCVKDVPELAKAIQQDGQRVTLMNYTVEDIPRIEQLLWTEDCWWLGNDGLHFEYNMGEFAVSYADHPDLFREGISDLSGSRMTLLPRTYSGDVEWHQYIGDGIENLEAYKIELTPEAISGSQITVYSGSYPSGVIIKETGSYYLQIEKAYLVNIGEKKYYLIQSSEYEKAWEVYLVDINGERPVLKSQLAGYIDDGAVNPEGFHIYQSPKTTDGETADEVYFVNEDGELQQIRQS